MGKRGSSGRVTAKQRVARKKNIEIARKYRWKKSRKYGKMSYKSLNRMGDLTLKGEWS